MSELRDTIAKYFRAGKTNKEICQLVDRGKSTVSWHIKQINDGIPHKPAAGRRYDWSVISAYYKTCNSIRKTALHFGMSKSSIAKARDRGVIDTKSPPTLSERILNGEPLLPVSRGSLKKHLIDNHILRNQCDLCDAQPIWKDKPLVLVLDHINGINNDNRLTNLRLLCPNCNSQTETFAGRNVKKTKGLN